MKTLYMENKIVVSKAKCPNCQSNNLMLVESWKDHCIEWEQLNGEFNRNDGVLDCGNPHRVEGRCKDCKHVWKFRRITQIDELIKDYD